MFPFFILLTVLFMKLLMILTELAPGGAEKVVLELTRQLRCRAHDVTVVSLMPEPPEERRAIPEGLSACGAKVIYLNVVKKAPWRLLSLFRVIREEKPDVIHSHLIHPNLLSRFVNLWTRKPLVNTVHIAERRPGKGLFFRLDGLTFSWCGACTAVSKAAARFHEKRCGLKENSIRVIYNGSDRVAPASAEQLRQLKKEWGLEPCRKIIGSVGRLDWQKGYDLLFGVLPELSRRIPRNESVGIVVIGDGPEREKTGGAGARHGGTVPEPENLSARLQERRSFPDCDVRSFCNAIPLRGIRACSGRSDIVGRAGLLQSG